MKTAIVLLFTLPLAAQLPQATGDEFTVAVYHDVHTDNFCPTIGACGPTDVAQKWVDAVDWLLGVNGRGPAGQSAITYWNIKAIAGVGDYVTTSNTNNWAAFMAQWNRIHARGLPGAWPLGNHDGVQYTADFGSTLQSTTFDVPVTGGIVRLGFLGVGVADNMASGQASRTFVDAAIAASQSNRQWIFLRHVGTYDFSNGGQTYAYPANGNSGWCIDNTQCAAWGNAGQTGVELRDNFYQHESRVFWGIHGHNGYWSPSSLVADDGHTVHAVGHVGSSGGFTITGWITLMKFRPAHNDIQVALYQGSTGVAGTLDQGPFTWAWTPQYVVSSTSVSGPASIRGGIVR